MAEASDSTLPTRCLECGAAVAQVTRMRREYCSDTCKAARKRRLRREKRPPECTICGTRFQRSSNRQKVCLSCRDAKKRLYTRAYNAEQGEALLAKRRAYMRERRSKALERERERNRTWWADNRDKIAARRKTESARRKARNYMRAKYAADPAFAIHARMASAVWQALRERKSGRKWESLVGYTLAELMVHLERQFQRGMSWANMGEWHVDHIIPRASFKYDSPDDPEFKACWALTNLRPLWSDDNQKKHAKRLFLL